MPLIEVKTMDVAQKPKRNLFMKCWNWLKQRKLLTFAFLFISVGTIGARTLLTDFNTIDIMEFRIPVANGQWVEADLYKPKSATEANKAPCVIVVPGFQRTKESTPNMSLELARRGLVTITIDPSAQGDSSASFASQAATTEGYGLFAMVDYVYSTPNMNYVDKTKIGATGHSAGGNAAIRGAAYFGVEAIDLGRPSKLHSIYVTGYVLTLTQLTVAQMRSNVGIDYPLYDEGAYRNVNAGTAGVRDADMRYAAESIALVNSGLAMNSAPTINQVEIGRLYGSPFNYSLRQVNNSPVLHAFQPYDSGATAKMVDFFELAFDMDFTIAATNQTYLVKEVFQGLLLVGMALFIFGFGAALLKSSFFKSIKRPLPERSKAPRGWDKALFWIAYGISVLVACFAFVPMAQTSITLFPEANNGVQTWVFPARMTNAVLLWALLGGTIGFILFFGIYLLRGKKNEASLEPLKISFGNLMKTLLFGITVLAAFYAVVYLVFYLFQVDPRFLFISARAIDYTKILLISLMYIPLFFVFYISNSIRVNMSMRHQGWSEGKSVIIAILGNSIGLILILVLQYSVFAATGQVLWKDEWLFVNLVFGLILMMMILPVYNRFFYNRSGNVYLGAIITCLIFIIMTLSNTVIYIPL